MRGAKVVGPTQARAMRSCTRVRLGLLHNGPDGGMLIAVYDGHGIRGLQRQRTLSRLGRNARPIGVQRD